MDCDCGEQLNNKWNYCPNCGIKLKKKGRLIGFTGILNEVRNAFESLFSPDKQVQPTKSGFTIRIKTGSPFEPEEDFKPARVERKLGPSLKLPKKLEEPKSKMSMHGDDIEVNIELPEVKSINDIELTRVGDSLEVRAVAKGKGYFKIINVPSEYKLINKKLHEGLLAVKLTR